MKVFYLPKVTKFVESLSNGLKDNVLSLVDIVEESNKPITMPYSKSLGNGLFELRIVGEVNIRIFYCFYKDVVYLLPGIIKKTQKTPANDIEYARKMKKVVEQL